MSAEERASERGRAEGRVVEKGDGPPVGRRFRIRRWEFWLVVVLIAGALLAHAMLPRYVPNGGNAVLDRWTGTVCTRNVCYRGGRRVRP